MAKIVSSPQTHAFLFFFSLFFRCPPSRALPIINATLPRVKSAALFLSKNFAIRFFFVRFSCPFWIMMVELRYICVSALIIGPFRSDAEREKKCIIVDTRENDVSIAFFFASPRTPRKTEKLLSMPKRRNK